MNGTNNSRCRPPLYSCSGWRLDVATSTSPLSHSRPNSLQGCGWVGKQAGGPAERAGLDVAISTSPLSHSRPNSLWEREQGPGSRMGSAQ